MKAKYILFAPILLGALFVLFSSSSGGTASSGNGNRTGSPGSNGTCANCHSGGTFGTTISATVTDTAGNVVTSYIPGGTYFLEYQVSATSGTPTFGFQSVILTGANANAGGFDSVLTTRTKITNVSGLMMPEHNARSITGNFKVRWVAPASGTGMVTLYYIGNAVNSDFNTTGDLSTIGQSLTLSENTTLQISLTQEDFIQCNGDANALLKVSTTSGAHPIHYIWSTGFHETVSVDSSTVQGLSGGLYTVTVIDANSVAQTASISVSEPAQILTSIAKIDETCFQLSDGEANVNVSGGQVPYTYLWSNGSTSPQVSGLTGGSYSVSITDNNACSVIDFVSIQAASKINITDVKTNPSCQSGTDGVIDVTVGGGIKPYSYLWDNGEITPSISSLVSGVYEVTVTDANLCQETKSITLTSDQKMLKVELGADTVFCSSGWSLTLDAGALVSNYDYLWNTGETSYAIDVDSFGLYWLKVTDSISCSGHDTMNIILCIGTGPDLFAQNIIQVYPTPASSVIYITSSEKGQIKLLDNSGKEILTHNQEIGNSEIDVSHLSSGVYYLLFITKENSGVQKVIIQNR